MAQSEHYDKEGIIYTSNNKYSYNLMKVCKNNTHTFIHLPIENNIIIPKNIFVSSKKKNIKFFFFGSITHKKIYDFFMCCSIFLSIRLC